MYATTPATAAQSPEENPAFLIRDVARAIIISPMKLGLPASVRVLVLPLCLSGCATAPAPVDSSPSPETSGDPSLTAALAAAPGATASAPLSVLLRDHWAWRLASDPVTASSYGVHAYDNALSARGPDASAESRRVRDAFLTRARSISTDALSPADQVTLRLFMEELEASQNADVCVFDEWTLSPRGNPITEFNYLPEIHPADSAEDAANYLARVEAIPASIDATLDSLESGVTRGLFANAESSGRVLEMVKRQLAQPLEEWPMFAPAARYAAVASDEDAARFTAALTAALKDGVAPALDRYGTFIETRVLPSARSDEAPGLSGLEIGEPCYEALVRAYTTLPMTAAEVHETGLREIAKINQEMMNLGEKLFGTRDLPTILTKLRTDRALYFETRDGVQAAAQEVLDEAREAMPRFFGRLPKADCTVVPIPEYEAPFTTIAYYREPNPDGSKPGEYYINTYDPSSRPRYEARVLGVHEAIPGHHLQIAIAQELPDLPSFRKYGGMTVFVEGWALYTERLAEEMGLYHDDLDRMGMLSFDAWRASRLVVDTGLHAKGWSRQEAVQFMLDHTALAANNIDNEVDRYIVWPGQALAYKTGQLEIWALRRRAEEALKDAFVLSEFHTVLLSGGAVNLLELRRRVDAWIAAQGAGISSAPPS